MMQARTIGEGWRMSSVWVKLGIIATGLIVLAMLLVGGYSYFQSRAYEKREAKREAERVQLEAEKDILRAEKTKALNEAAEAKAAAEVYETVADTKRADRTTTVKELEAIEQQHQTRKAEVEAQGGTLSDDELVRALCERMAKRGYPPCPGR